MNAASTKTAEYELVMMLDPEAPDERRDQIAANALSRIEAAGNLKHERTWGMRKLAYEIRQRTEADYRFFRFESEGSLLDELDHNLKITDGVLRFRIFRVDPGSPVIEPPPPVALAGSTGRGPGGGRRGGSGRPPRGPEDAHEPVDAAAPAEQPPQPAEAAPSAESAEGGAAAAPGGDEPAAPEDEPADD